MAAIAFIPASTFWIAAGLLSPPPEVHLWTLPKGFTLERVAGPPHIRYPMFAALDDRGRLFVAESSGGNLYEELREQSRRCRIVLLEDTNGDGFFDHAQTFADSLAFPMGLVWHQGRLYVADPPHLIALLDSNGDGRADTRQILLTGFGHASNGSLHGLTVGPDGWLYMTVGWPDAYRLQRPDGTWLEGKSGAVLRCRLDGSDPQVIAVGLENPVELAWMPTGELLATNNWHTEPAGGVRDALLHIVEGGIYPRHAWREDTSPLPTTGPWLPAIALRPAVAHSGMVRYAGTAFPENRRGLFVAEFNTRNVVRYALMRDGSTFRSEIENFLAHTDPAFRPSDVLEAFDGSLLVVDTGVWYIEHCPTGHIGGEEAVGGIWRIRFGDRRVNDPAGEEINWLELQSHELSFLLADERPAVRRRAGELLERRGPTAVDALKTVIADTINFETAIRAAWVLGRIPDTSAIAPLRNALAGPSWEIASSAARALGARAALDSAPDLENLLLHPDKQLRLAAAEALSRIGTERSADALIRALAAPDLDRVLESALAYALYRSADTEKLREALDHPHARVQRVALYLLNDRKHEALTVADVTARATAEDAELRAASLDILRARPQWADHAVNLMRRLARSNASEEHELLGAYARAFAFHPPAAELIANVISGDGGVNQQLRRRLIEAITEQTGEVPAAWRQALGRAMMQDLSLRMPAIEATASLGVTELDAHLTAILEDTDEDPAVRIRTLEILSERQPALLNRYSRLLIERLEEEPGPARIHAAQLLARTSLEEYELDRLVEIASRDPAVDPLLVLEAAENSEGATSPDLLSYLKSRVTAGWMTEADRLTQLARRALAAGHRDADQLMIAALSAEEEREALWKRFEPLLTGGDPERGRQLFFARAGCVSCHSVEGIGGAGGPDLSRIGLIRSGPAILQALLFPSSTTTQGYEAWVVETVDGRLYMGMLDRARSDPLVLRDLTGRETRLAAADVKSSQPLGRSLMPEGLLGALTDEEARDLLSYLQSLN